MKLSVSIPIYGSKEDIWKNDDVVYGKGDHEGP